MTVFGNDKVVAALERLLVEARKGQHGYLIATMVGKDVPVRGGWWGSIFMEADAVLAHDKMTDKWADDIGGRIMEPRAADVPADRVCYNIMQFPASYDFISWLVDAEMTRRIENVPAPLKVHFWRGRDGKSGLDDPARRQMFENVLRPALSLVGAVEDEAAADGRCSPVMQPRNIIARAMEGYEVPRLSAPRGYVLPSDYSDAVTITLREYGHFQYRNSKFAEWMKFARYLKEQGERVIFVRDTTCAHAPIDGFETCPPASLDLHRRVALYEAAKMNLFVSNGPGSLGFYGDWPWLMFMPMCDDDYEYEPNTPKFWREHVGIEMGGQFPWWRPHDQKIVWKDDLLGNMVEAWENLGI